MFNCFLSLFDLLIEEQKLGELNLLYSILHNTFNPVHMSVNQVLIHITCLFST